MNSFYHYKYSNGVQFVSQANPKMLQSWLIYNNYQNNSPKLLGIWRFKNIKHKNK